MQQLQKKRNVHSNHRPHMIIGRLSINHFLQGPFQKVRMVFTKIANISLLRRHFLKLHKKLQLQLQIIFLETD